MVNSYEATKFPGIRRFSPLKTAMGPTARPPNNGHISFSAVLGRLELVVGGNRGNLIARNPLLHSKTLSDPEFSFSTDRSVGGCFST